MSKNTLAVFIGRFSLCHLGHQSVFQSALEHYDNLLILVGSSYQPRTAKNPWTYEERVGMIKSTIPSRYHDRVFIKPLRDKKYNDVVWSNQVASIVNHVSSSISATEVKLVGHDKDDTSWYLHVFPQWGEPHLFGATIDLSATDIREILLEGKSLRYLSGVVATDVIHTVADFVTTEAYDNLKTEHRINCDYRQKWAGTPYPVNFVTVDSVIIHPSGRLLVGHRKSHPGQGLLALPGGFLEANETIIAGTLRELDQETRIKMAPAALRGSIKKTQCYDDPSRSARGRTLTHASLFQLPPGPLPKVRGGDDLIGKDASTMWRPIISIREDEMFEDHYHIVQHLTENYIDYDIPSPLCEQCLPISC